MTTKHNGDINQDDNEIGYHYIIEQTIIFIPEKNLLSSREGEDDVIMHTPAARCLKKLLDEQGNIINYNLLISAGWPGGEDLVTLNTLYQAISHIRRSLKEFMPDNSIITTIKKKGLVIYDSVQVEKIKTHDTQSLAPIFRGGELKKNNQNTREPIKIANLTGLVFTLFVMCIVIFIIQKCILNDSFPPFFNGFVYYSSTSSGCKIYINKDEGRALNSNMPINLRNFDCRGFQRSYVTQWDNRVRSSAVLCKNIHQKERKLECKTFYNASHSK